MKKSFLTCLLVSFWFCFSQAQTVNQCACCTQNHQAFDYWSGDWTVFNLTGNVIGTNNVVKMENGCVLQENWKAANDINTGTSYNFYDSRDSTWNQVWISNTGNVLNLKGNIDEDGNMILRSELTSSPQGNFYNQITWTQNQDGTVTQKWDILNEHDEPISNAFEGIYKKTKSLDR